MNNLIHNSHTVQIRHENCIQSRPIPPLSSLHNANIPEKTLPSENFPPVGRMSTGTQIKQSRGTVNNPSTIEICQNKTFIPTDSLLTPLFSPVSISSPHNNGVISQNHKIISGARIDANQISLSFHPSFDNSSQQKRHVLHGQETHNNLKLKKCCENNNKERVIDNVLRDEEDNTSSYNCKLFISPMNEQNCSAMLSTGTKIEKFASKQTHSNSFIRATSNRHSKVANKATSTNSMISKSTSCIAKLSSKDEDKKQKVQENFKSRSSYLRNPSARGLAKSRNDNKDHFSNSLNSCNAIPSSCDNIYDIPPPNYLYDPNRSIEKLL